MIQHTYFTFYLYVYPLHHVIHLQTTAHLLVLGSLQWGRKHQCDPLVNRAVSSLLQALVVCSVLAFPRSTSLSRSATLKGEKEHELLLNSTTWREKITRKANSPIGSMYGTFTCSCHTFEPYMDPMGQDSNTGNFWQPSYHHFSLAQAARSCRIASFTATEAQWSSNINLGKSWWFAKECFHWKISLFFSTHWFQSHQIMISTNQSWSGRSLKWNALKNAYLTYIYICVWVYSIHIWHVYYINCSNFTCRNDNYKQCTSPSTQNISFPKKVSDLFTTSTTSTILKGIPLPPIKGSRHGAREVTDTFDLRLRQKTLVFDNGPGDSPQGEASQQPAALLGAVVQLSDIPGEVSSILR